MRAGYRIPRGRAIDEDLVAVGFDVERLNGDVWIDDGAVRNGKGILGRSVADELGPRNAESVYIGAEVFLDGKQRIIGPHRSIAHGGRSKRCKL